MTSSSSVTSILGTLPISCYFLQTIVHIISFTIDRRIQIYHSDFFFFFFFFGFCFWLNKFLNIQPHVFKPACNTCNKTVSHRNLIIYAQCFKLIHLKCNNLNFVDGQLIKNSNSSWLCLHCSNNIFPLY